MNKLSKLKQAQFDRVVDVVAGLSPENLTCDGLLTRAQVRKKFTALMKQKRALEKEFGFAFSEDEVWKEFVRRRDKNGGFHQGLYGG